MLTMMSFFFFAAAIAIITVHSSARRDIRLFASISIHRPAGIVFDIVEHVGREITWYRKSDWLPDPLHISQLSRWHEYIPPHQRHRAARSKFPAQLSIRILKDRELTYRSIREGGMDYECSFRLQIEDGNCLLTWEIRFQAHRLADILAGKRIVSFAEDSMARSLEYIHRIALASERPRYSRAELYRDPRGQIPAA